MGTITVVVADDDDRVRDSLTALLHTDARFEVVGHATTGADLLEVVQRTRPKVALVDVGMPGGGAPAVQALTTSHPVVALGVSAETTPRTIVAMLRAGARGYLVKGRISSSLPDLVARCLDGEVIVAAPTGAEALRQMLESGR